MPADIDHYLNREQSFIKHQFLTKYLQAAAYKTLQGKSPTFNFVDAFAGPWRVQDEAQYSDASFDQAINTLEAVRADLGRGGVGGLKLRFCFCERLAEPAARLRLYAKARYNIEIHVFEGLFEDNLAAIAAKIPDGFTFTFIDPKGWNIRNEAVFRFLRDIDGEFMLNFMSDHINRHATLQGVAASFSRFLADEGWAEDFARLPSAWSNEEKMLHLMKEALRKHKVATYAPDFSIMVPRMERVKMRLILGTHSAHGLEVFRNVQEQVEKQEMEMRQNLRDGDNPQVSLFSAEETAAFLQKTKGVGCKFNQDRAEAIMVDFLRGRTFSFPGPMYHAAMEAVAIRRTQLNTLLLDMRSRGVVRFDIAPPKRVPQDFTQVFLA